MVFNFEKCRSLFVVYLVNQLKNRSSLKFPEPFTRNDSFINGFKKMELTQVTILDYTRLYITNHYTNTVNDAQLDMDQLVEVKAECLVKPKAPNHTSIPAILKALQDEWDSVMANR